MAATTTAPESDVPVATKSDTVVFVEAAPSTDVNNPIGFSSIDVAGSVETREHSIATVLGRPVKILEVDWLSTDAPATVLSLLTLLEDYFRNHANAVSKISGFGLFRAKARIRVLINGSPSAYGILGVSILPQIPYKPASQDRTLAWLTGFEHMFLNLGSCRSAELVVPYINWRLWSDVGALFANGFGSSEALNLFDHAGLAVYVVTPLDSTTGTINVQVMCSLEDVEVRVPVPPIPFYTPSLVEGKQTQLSARRHREARQGGEGSAFSSCVATTSKVTRDAAGVVKNVGGLLSAMGGASIEPDLAPTVRVYPIGPAETATALAGPDPSIVLGGSRDAKALAPPGLFTRPGDMDLATYCMRPAIFDGFDWQTTDAPGTILAAYEVNPVTLPRQIANGTKLMQWVTIPLSYCTLLFRFYRGSLVYKFMFANNSFFSGRLRFVYMPFDRTARSGPISDEDLASVEGTVVDIRTQNEVEVTVPYVNNGPWAPVEPTDLGDGADPKRFSSQRPLGFLYVVVQTGLQVSEVVANPVCRVVTLKRAGSDYRLATLFPRAAPTFWGQEANTFTRATFLPTPEPIARHREARQGGGVYAAEGGPSITPTIVAPPTLPIGLMCQSEDISSWRDVVHRYTQLIANLDVIKGTAGGSLYDAEGEPCSMIYYARMAFAYYCGSLRFLNSVDKQYGLTTFCPFGDYFANSRAAAVPQVMWPVRQSNLNKYTADSIQAFKVPWVDAYPFLPTGDGSEPVGGTLTVDSIREGGLALVSNLDGTAYVSMGDDALFGVPIGTPCVTIFNDALVVVDETRTAVSPWT